MMNEDFIIEAEHRVVPMAAYKAENITERIIRPDFVITAEQILELGITEVSMLCPPILQKVGVASLCGSSDGGKSFLCLCLAIAICCDDNEVLGMEIRKEHGSVIIVCTEDSANDICVRLTALLGEKKLNQGKLRFIFETGDIPMKLKEELERQPADLVIMDTFRDLFRGNLNDSIDVSKFLEPYKVLAKKNKLLFLFCHHIGKGKENNAAPSKNDVLGSQGIESACRTVLMLKKRADSKRVLTVVKGNHLPEEVKNQGIVLEFDPMRGFWKSENDSSHLVVQATEKKLLEDEKKVIEYYHKFGNLRSAATELTKDGYSIGKTKMGEIIKKFRPTVQDSSE